MLKEIQEKLKKLGLGEKEIEIYMACLKSGEGLFVVDLVKETKIKRSTIDVVIQRLLNQGILTQHQDGRRNKFVAEDPKKLIESFERNIKELKDYLPLIYSQINKKGSTKVRFYHGTKSVLGMLNEIFLTIRVSDSKEKEMLSISNIDQMNIATDYKQISAQESRIKSRVFLRIISTDGELARKIKEEDGPKTLRKTKIFDDKKYPFNATLNIYENNISIFQIKGEPVGIIIEDTDLATSMKSIFELLWKSLD